jgi:osmotically-inducible protein OsmY
MFRTLAVVAAGLFLVTASHVSAAPVLSPAAQTASASAVAAKVKAKLDAEPDLKNHSITVTESKGTVTLEGEAPSVLGRAKAGEIATNTEGVKKVNNKVKVAKTESAGSQ